MNIDKLVDRFLAWPLPDSVCADLCAMKQGYSHRSGTNLLSAVEARQMFEHVLIDIDPLLKGLTWTSQKPKADGWYWYREDGTLRPYVVVSVDLENDIVGPWPDGIDDQRLSDLPGEWAGPVRPPQ